LQWVEERIIEAKLKFGINAVFIDHLHYVVDFLKIKGNASLCIGDAVRRLKLLAVKHGVVIFLMAHTQKLRFDSKPDIGDIRDSSFVAQEADIVFMIWRKILKDDTGEIERFGNDAKLGIFKNRRNGTLEIIKMKYENGLYLEV
jgi:replicative DNA helicase